jgi:hypothetical protein
MHDYRISKYIESKLAGDIKKLSKFLSTTDEMVEKVHDNPDGAVFHFMATMEYKHKSESATQQEARRVR